ncbi:MAG: Nif3-like dinuclear metal center hexameric protein [Saprospiraceae bacterium]
MAKLRQLIAYLERMAPPALQASYDNSGLLVGNPDLDIEGVLVSLDCTEEIIAEAVAVGANVVVAHHPIVFSGLKRITGKTYVERTIIAAIKNDVAIYAIHTNLDSVLARGVNGRIADRLGLENVKVLSPSKNTLNKLAVYVPHESTEAVATAMFEAGAGKIGDYDQASFRSAGLGTFRPLDGANPAIGEVGSQERVNEDKLEVIVPRVLAKAVLAAAKRAHPYEEVAYDLYALESNYADYGMGAYGELPEPMEYDEWMAHLCNTMELEAVKHTAPTGQLIKRVAVCGGVGSFLLPAAKGVGADVFVTADYKYHEFFDAEGSLVICDIGHYESERFTIDLLYEAISTRFDTFAARMTSRNTNPVRLYFPAGTPH